MLICYALTLTTQRCVCRKRTDWLILVDVPSRQYVIILYILCDAVMFGGHEDLPLLNYEISYIALANGNDLTASTFATLHVITTRRESLW